MPEPTDGQRAEAFELGMEAIVLAHLYADALISIGARFEAGPPMHPGPWCWMCGEAMEHGCDETCPGLVARRALGVG
jgi:hypothetical protein